ILQRYGADAITVDAVVSGLAGMEADVLERMLEKTDGPDTSEGVAMLAGAIARSRSAAALPVLIEKAAATTRPPWQRTALLRGIEAGLGPGERSDGSGPRSPTPPPPLRLSAAPTSLTRLTAESGDVGRLAAAVAARLDWPGKPAARAEAP